MSWKSIAAPLAVIVVGVVIVMLTLAASDNISSAPLLQVPSYPAQTQTAQVALTATAAAYPGTNQSVTPAATVTATVTSTVTTPTVTLSTPTVTTNQPTQPVRSARPTPRPPEDTLTPETTQQEALTPGATPISTVTCVPGESVLITGRGPPRAPFLLHFGQRVVGGGSVSLSGSFSIPLIVGRERPGSYPVMVQVRGSEQVLRELTCVVPPAVPPTPIKGAFT
jgi:hypothetical protein